LSYAPRLFYGASIRYVTMNIGHFQPWVSQPFTPVIKMHYNPTHDGTSKVESAF